MEDQKAEELWYQYHMMVNGPNWFKKFDCPMKQTEKFTVPKTNEELASDLYRSIEIQNKEIVSRMLCMTIWNWWMNN